MQVLIVLVRYKIALEQSQTIRSLSDTFEREPELLKSVRLLIWDNSPVALENPQLPFVFEYRHSEKNAGVSGAYNYAMALGESIGCPWMLLLDQDTIVPDGFIARMLKYSRDLQEDERIATVVPFIWSHNVIVSPRRLGRFSTVHDIPRTFHGVCDWNAYGINSATLMRISALKEIGGYSEQFWLDLSDIYVFYMFHRAKKLMYVAGDLELRHSIGSMDYNTSMSPARYQNFLAAENAYMQLYRSRLENAYQTFRLLIRSWRQYKRYTDKEFSRITLRSFWQRLFCSRSSRMQKWRAELHSRDIPSISHAATKKPG